MGAVSLLMRPAALADALDGWPPPVLDPAGPYSAPVTTLAWALLVMAIAVLGVVLAALAIALFGKERLRSRIGGERMIWAAGIGFPVIVLTGLLLWGLILTSDLAAPPRGDEMRIRVTGEMWWWRVAYLDRDGRPAMQDANELHIPAGTRVALELDSADVIHSFWVPRLAGKLDMVPGQRNILTIRADRPGLYGGQCAEYCGGPHALMGFVVVAHAPADYARWRAARAAPRPPADPGTARGAGLFLANGCGACHRVAGTAANGLAGPDLSHVGSRRSLGAGILPNDRAALARWIADSQRIKPGNRMPAYPRLARADVDAIAAWLEQQR